MKKILSLDLECANTYAYRSICQIGGVLSDENFNVVKEFDWLVNPRVNRFHAGDIPLPYTIAELKKQPDFSEYAPDLFGLIDEDTVLLGHSLHNDISMLNCACAFYDIAPPDFKYIDSNVLVSAAEETFNERSLSVAASAIGLEFQAHDPLDDARAALKITEQLLKDEKLDAFMQKHGVSFGFVGNYLMTRPVSAYMSQKTLYKNKKVEELYRYISQNQRARGKRLAIDKNLIYAFDLKPLAEKLIAGGAVFCDDKKLAAEFITAAPREKKDVAFDAVIEKIFNEKASRVKSRLKDRRCPNKSTSAKAAETAAN